VSPDIFEVISMLTEYFSLILNKTEAAEANPANVEWTDVDKVDGMAIR
jgi:hypothetical protein